jgi:hypothetical protein
MRIGGEMSRERRALAVLVAVLALLVQGLVPAAAMASAPTASAAMIICTGNGVTTVTEPGSPSKPKGFAGMPCQDCLAATLAATQASPALAILPVIYATARIERPPSERLIEPRARAPPRPPGQGPPIA